MTAGRGLLAVRPGEGRLVALLAGLFASVEAARGLGEVAATTLFLSRVGSELLPWLFIALGAVSMIAALGYGVGIGRLPRRGFIVSLFAAFALLLVLLRVAIASELLALYGLLWVAVNVVNAILLTVVWTIAGTTLDARQAKRLFPVCMSAAIAGGFAGTLAAGPLTGLLGPESLVVLDALLLLGGGAVAASILHRAARGRSVPRHSVSVPAQLRAGLDDVRRSPLLRLVAVAYVLFGILLFSVSFPYQGALETAFRLDAPAGQRDVAGLATFVGLLLAGVTAASFVVSITLANRVYARFGVATAALALPLVYLAGFGVWLVEFSLATAAAFTFVQQVVQRSISNAAWSAMYNVVPAERRPQALAFIDAVPGQLGQILSGVLLLAAGILFSSRVPIFVMGLLAAAVCIWVVLRIRRQYGRALLETLRAGEAEQVLEGGPGLAAIGREPGVLEGLRSRIADPNPAVRRLAVTILGRLGDRDAAPAVARLLDDDDPWVRAAAVRSAGGLDSALVLARADGLAADANAAVRFELAGVVAGAGEGERAEAILEDMLDAESADERALGLVVAGRIGRPSMQARMTAALADRAPRVRAAAAIALARTPEAADRATTNALLAALDDEAFIVRRAAAGALAERPDAAGAVAAVLAGGSERAQEAAILALGADDGDTRGPAQAWAAGRVERMIGLRAHAAALDPGEAGQDEPALEFLRSVIAGRERRTQAQLLAAIAALGAPEASGLLRRCLQSRDPDVRAQAIEAVEAIGDRHLARLLVRLLDAAPPRASADAGEALRVLAEDPDQWIRVLALRALTDRAARVHADLMDRARGDADPIVRANVGTMAGDAQPASSPAPLTMSELDRMLVLRTVPLFGDLDPEDLQRIAASALERRYLAGEELVREGELGDELIVIVEGHVRVVRVEDGGERLLRTYGPGNHIGELAVLRDRPRAATVIANDEVLGLVIGGEALRAILHERPEVAMAMLATLAERISTQ
ncbi:MAG TPA: HEAT repeat domain-containing protein [Clostridia bacterium]|nr:HEAT repeat domain-containing protein [Clostridia bacterium]